MVEIPWGLAEMIAQAELLLLQRGGNIEIAV